MKTLKLFKPISVITFILITGAISKGHDDKGRARINKAASIKYYAPMLINNVYNYYSNNGDGSFNIYSTSGEGFEFPKGSNDGTTVFEDGLVWTAFKNGTLYCGGSTYNHGLQPGRILTEGTSTTLPVADDPAKPEYRVFRVRPDMKPVTSADDIANENAILTTQELPLINRFTNTTVEKIRQQYWDDWNEWPAEQGAPYADVNKDGIYEPSIDIPGFPGASQTEWMVMNDLNKDLTFNLYTSAPIGIEVQRTIWAYNQTGVLGNTIFVRYKLINRSGVSLDSVYLSPWADPDLGYAGDDLVGYDTSLDLEYCYNSGTNDASYDQLSLAPPSVGYILLQGPVVPSSSNDSATIGGKRIHGLKNLPVTSFVYVYKSGDDSDPDLNSNGPGGTNQWYNFMRGLHKKTAEPNIDPLTGDTTKFILTGDPVTQTGWIDGVAVSAGDRRLGMSSGPFVMAPGDTQEVIIATVGALGDDRLSSITLLRSYCKEIKKIYDRSFKAVRLGLSTTVTASGNMAAIHVSAHTSLFNISNITVTFRNSTGAFIASTLLEDDGAHGDSKSGDGVFGSNILLPQQPEALYADELVHYTDGDTAFWFHAADNITTASPVSIISSPIVSDNINDDGIANPGENVRYTLAIKNGSTVALSDMYIKQMGVGLVTPISIGSLSSGAEYTQQYDPINSSSYFSFSIPSDFVGSSYSAQFQIYDTKNNIWYDSISIPVTPATYPYVNGTTKHSSGFGDGDFDITVFNAFETTDHTYLIHWVDSINEEGEHGYSVEDSTTGENILYNHPLPDRYGHNSPEIDGFKILFGSIDTIVGIKDWNVYGTRHWTFSNASGLKLDGFSGAIGTGSTYWYSGSSVSNNIYDIEIDFPQTDTSGIVSNPNDSSYSFAYRYLRNAMLPPAQPSFAPYIVNPGSGFAYQDYNKSMPLAAYQVSPTNRKRLMVGFLENNVSAGLVDGRYRPPYYGNMNTTNTDTAGPMEWFFVFDKDYSTTPDPTFMVDLSTTTVPMLIFGTPVRRDMNAWDPWVFSILTHHNPTNDDVWSFTPTRDVKLPPTTFDVPQNFPNPFNLSTTMRYTLPLRGRVTITIYDVLGRFVRTLIDEEQTGGVHNSIWNGRNSEGGIVSSGMYILRFMFTGADQSHTSFSSIKKMMVVK